LWGFRIEILPAFIIKSKFSGEAERMDGKFGSKKDEEERHLGVG
jgi:hypothetical protein